LLKIDKPVDVRDLSAMIVQSDRAVLYQTVNEYPDWRVGGGLVSTRKRLALATGATEVDIAMRFEEKPHRPIEPVLVDGPYNQ